MVAFLTMGLMAATALVPPGLGGALAADMREPGLAVCVRTSFVKACDTMASEPWNWLATAAHRGFQQARAAAEDEFTIIGVIRAYFNNLGVAQAGDEPCGLAAVREPIHREAWFGGGSYGAAAATRTSLVPVGQTSPFNGCAHGLLTAFQP
jgi:hypothetical protein